MPALRVVSGPGFPISGASRRALSVSLLDVLAQPRDEVILDERPRRNHTEDLVDCLRLRAKLEALALEIDIHQDEGDPLVAVGQRMVACA